MKLITRMELLPGMVLGEDVIAQGKILYNAGTKMDNMTIEKLKRYSVMCVTVKEDIDFASTHYEKIRFDEKFRAFEVQYNESLFVYKNIMRNFLTTGVRIKDDVLMDIYGALYAKISSGATLLDYLYNMVPNEDELTYTHCLNSALLAGTFADWLAMNPEAKKTLILSGFYYDIGKLSLPYNVLWKPSKLTPEEFAMVKQHPVIGYNLIRNLNLNEHVKNAVIMHHERLDGSGYPYQFSGSKIDIYARYVAIVDAYIAMASPRSYRDALTPLQILGNFEKSIEKYDVELLMPLMKRISDAQIGSTVRLNNDSVWEVLIIHPNKFSRPILRNENSEILDLLEHPELEIIKNI